MNQLDSTQLIALNALLEEAHVTRAAKRLGITQSSMSHRLAQLRQFFNDPLLIRVGSGLELTPKASAIAIPLAEALKALSQAINIDDAFDPANSIFKINIMMPDLLAVLSPRLATGLLTAAPKASISIRHLSADLSKELGKDSSSLALTPFKFVQGDILSRAIGKLRFGVVGRKNHPALRRNPTLKQWLQYRHITVKIGNESSNIITEELKRLNIERPIALEVPSFLSGLHVLPQSDFLMNVPLPLAKEAITQLGLQLREIPILLPQPRFSIAWHPRYQNDPAHTWARNSIFEAIRPAFDELPISTSEA